MAIADSSLWSTWRKQALPVTHAAVRNLLRAHSRGQVGEGVGIQSERTGAGQRSHLKETTNSMGFGVPGVLHRVGMTSRGIGVVAGELDGLPQAQRGVLEGKLGRDVHA